MKTKSPYIDRCRLHASQLGLFSSPRVQPPPFPRGSFARNCSAWIAMLLLFLGVGLSPSVAQNILTNPGFELGGADWSASFLRGATGNVVTNAGVAHSGNNYFSTTGVGGWASVGEGDASGPYPTGTGNYPITATDFYQLRAWVKVPGASTTPQPVTLRYRFEPSGNRNDVGTQTIGTENWTQVTSPWIQPASLAGGSGDYFMSYFEVHSLNNDVTMYVDDCEMFHASAYAITGQVVSNSIGVDGVTVSGSFGAYAASATTAGGGYYTLTIPPVNGSWTLNANTPGYLGSTSVAVSSSSTAAPNIVLGVDPNYDPNLLFSIHSSDYTASNNWACVEPVGTSLVNFSGTPGTTIINGQNWELNHRTTSDAFQFPGPGAGGQWTSPIAVNGATIVTAVRPLRNATSDSWNSVVDIMYNRLCLCVNNFNGNIQVWLNGTLTTGPALPNGQIAILSLVVQADGSYNVYTNGNATPAMTVAGGSGMTSLDPTWNGGGLGYWSYIDVGKNQPDAWPCFNGNIGDTYVYKIGLNEAARTNLEASLIAKYGAAPIYTITATAGANGTITPSGVVAVPMGLNQGFTITPASGYLQNVTVDGVSQGAITSYTFSNVATNHTIDAVFTLLPPQNVSGTVTNSIGVGIPNATVYFSTSNNASASPIFTTVTDGSGNYTQALYNATWYVSASGATNLPSGDITFTTTGVPLTGMNIGLLASSGLNVPQQSSLLFSALSANCQSTNAPWPTFMPKGLSLTAIGAPNVATNGSTVWEANTSPTQGDGFRFFKGVYGPPSTTIPMNGGTIVVVCQPDVGTYGPNAFQDLVSCFENNFSICVDRSTGNVSIGVQAGAGGPNISTGVILSSGQQYVLSLVVQPAGGATLYVNGAPAWSGSTPTLTSISPQAFYNVDLNIGMAWEGDGWSSFVGLIGDTFVYKTALNSTDRAALENSLLAKFSIAPALTYKWAGPNNGNWSDPGNWNSAVPGPGDLATFSDSASAGATVQLDTAASVKGLEFNNLVPNSTIASSLGNTLTFDDNSFAYTTRSPITVDAGSATISAGVEAYAGIEKNGSGKLTLSGSTDIGTYSAVNPALVVGGGELELAGPATLEFTRMTGVHGGSTLTISGAFTSSDADQKIGDDFGAGPGYAVLKGSGSWTHTGSGVFCVGVLQYPGTLTINDNAMLDLSGQSSGYGFLSVALGYGGGSTGTVIQNGGTVKTEAVGAAWNGSGGPGVILGNWTGDPCTAEYDLNGGTLITPNVYNVNSSGGVLVAPNGSAVFKFNGGVLQGTQNDNQGDPQVVAEGSTNLMGNLTHAYVQAGGAKINAGTFNCGINQSLEHDPAMGATMDGGLTVQGSGTLTLYRPSTYTGPTKVQGGVLACATNTALGGGSLDISTGGSVALNYSGTRTISQLTFNAGSPQPNGTYGATGSGATTIDNTHFSGTGTVTVAPPVPPTPVWSSSAITMSGGVPTFTFATVAGYKYRLVYKNNLTDASWTVVINPPNYPSPDGWGAVSTGTPATISDPGAVGQSKRFYRVEVANP